jgi:hypothetical protein
MIWSPPIFETKTCWWSLGLIDEAARRMTEQTSVLMLITRDAWQTGHQR